MKKDLDTETPKNIKIQDLEVDRLVIEDLDLQGTAANQGLLEDKDLDLRDGEVDHQPTETTVGEMTDTIAAAGATQEATARSRGTKNQIAATDIKTPTKREVTTTRTIGDECVIKLILLF